MGIEFTGKLRTPEVKKQLRAAAARGLGLAAEHIMGEAKKTVPLEEGTLERSHATSVDEKKLRAAVSADTPYAAVQHEDMTLNHNQGRTAKWLENAMNSEAKQASEIIAKTIRGEF